MKTLDDLIIEYVENLENGLALREARLQRHPSEDLQQQVEHWQQTLDAVYNGGLVEHLTLTNRNLVSDFEARRVDIVVLKYKLPNVEIECMAQLIKHTDWPYKVTWYDARNQTANFSKLWNRLAYESTCDYICIMDSDAFVTPHWLENMMACFQPEFMCADLASKTPKKVKADPVGVVVPVTHTAGAHTLQGKYWKEKSPCIVSAQVSGFFFLFRKALLDDIGYFDERFYLHGQDSEWFDRVIASNWNIVMCRNVYVDHMVSASIKKATDEGEFDYATDIQMTKMIYDLIRAEKIAGSYKQPKYENLVGYAEKEVLGKFL